MKKNIYILEKNFKKKNSKRLIKNINRIFGTIVTETYENSRHIKPSYYSLKIFKLKKMNILQ